MIQNVSMIGTPRTSRATATLAVPRIDRIGQRVADEHHPARAGEDRGRVEVPAQEAEQRAGQGEAQQGDVAAGRTGRRSTVRLIRPRVNAAIRPIPLDRPSRPSIQLMLLIMPTIQKIVKATPHAPSSVDLARPERVGDRVDRDPEQDRADRQQRAG